MTQPEFCLVYFDKPRTWYLVTEAGGCWAVGKTEKEARQNAYDFIRSLKGDTDYSVEVTMEHGEYIRFVPEPKEKPA